ncbi:MAG TPA: hypothetical protein VJ600_09490 [Holophagaceae bacterium]|nr:hypothetical protein [Holophagaceae bacterium]
MKPLLTSLVLGLGALTMPLPPLQTPELRLPQGRNFESAIVEAFAKQGIRLSMDEARRILPNVRLALQEARAHGLGDSKVDFACVEMGQDLGLDLGPGSNTVNALRGAVGWLLRHPLPEVPSWDAYYDGTLNLWNRPGFMDHVQRAGFSPVKISWEDIGRYENSVWGDRISDVGIWVRRREEDPSSARLALSVRRDGNFRDKVLVVPADRIKVHRRSWGRTLEQSLPERLRELGLQSQARDRSVIVSNQFAIVPVPSRSMAGAWNPGVPPRAAFTFSIYPYGSTNFVITDVIEGSSEAIVGPGSHQLLYANVNGRRAPFTASRAEDRQDLLQMERGLKARGMDVDVQRYYLIQIPLKRDAAGLQLSNMGTPPMDYGYGVSVGMMEDSVGLPSAAAGAPESMAKQAPRAEQGLSKVAIGHGEAEGAYFTGAGWQGQRAEEPIRVTVVYFVTPVGEVTERDMAAFSEAFKAWDRQAIWGGSFVTKQSF